VPYAASLTKVYFAYQFAQNGGKVRLQSYLAMPHIFPMFQKHPSTKTCFRQYAKFIREVTSGESIETEMQIVNGKGIIEAAPLEFESYQISFTKEEVFPNLMLVTAAIETNGIGSITTTRHAQTPSQTNLIMPTRYR